MVTEQPNVASTGRYPIGKAAQALGIDRKTLRLKYYANEIKAVMSRDGKVRFTGDAIIRFWMTH